MAGQASTPSGIPPQASPQNDETFPFLSQLADQADLCLVVIDADDRIIYTNAGFSKLLGYDRAATRGQYLRKLLTGEDLHPRRRFGADAPQQLTFQERLFARTQDGNQIWITGAFRRVFDDAGNVRCTAGMLLDVTGNVIQAMQREVLDAMVAGGSLEQIGDVPAAKPASSDKPAPATAALGGDKPAAAPPAETPAPKK